MVLESVVSALLENFLEIRKIWAIISSHIFSVSFSLLSISSPLSASSYTYVSLLEIAPHFSDLQFIFKKLVLSVLF